MTTEFDLIERYFRRLGGTRPGIVQGIGDDCARVTLPPGSELAVSIDTLVAGVHFPEFTSPEDIGWKSLACGLSDLAAAGAEPAWATLAITLPHGPDPDAWLDAFVHGFGELGAAHGLALIGGDTTSGPLSVTVQVAGHVPAGAALGRGGARPGDAVCVSGWPGEAAAALTQLQCGAPEVDHHLYRRLSRPEPRVALGLALRGRASACIDVSDGLAADLGHVIEAGGVGAVLDLDALPVSSTLAAAGDTAAVRDWILHGGDDYELCFCLPAERLDTLRAELGPEPPLSRIGHVVAEPGLWARDGADATPGPLDPRGYRHFHD
ncbi:MAG: thiamine-phosphate kinase [Halofilum sp. (in: g-proteobacteria)]|nr:thiamine-phosphate kinase [Halofilum sp. (in: g-proteobacteria)]